MIPEPTSQEMELLKSLMKSGNPIFFNRLRHDGAGATVLNMLYAAAYAEKLGWKYGGAVAYWVKGKFYNHKHLVNVPAMVEFTFGRPMIFQNSHISALNTSTTWVEQVYGVENSLESFRSGAREATNVIVLDSYNMHKIEDMLPTEEMTIDGGRTYLNVSNLGQLMTPSFISNLRAGNMKNLQNLDLLFKKGVPTLAIHMRRGDVGPEHSNRYTENSYYIELVRRIRKVLPDVDCHAFSSLEGKHQEDEFREFQQESIHLHFEDVSAQLNWAHFIKADILIMAKSSYSHTPALINPNCIVYEPYHAGKLPHWVTKAQITDEYIRNCYKKKFKSIFLNSKTDHGITQPLRLTPT